MKVSVLSYSFRGLLQQGLMDIFGYLESCRYRYHLSAADVWSGFFPSLEPNFLRQVKDALEERGLILADLAVDEAHIWEHEPAVREQNAARARGFLRAAAFLAAKFVRIDAGGRDESWTDQQLELIVERYREYAQYAYDHGFRVGIENHWGPERTWANLKQVYEAVDHPGFAVSCHIGGWAGSPEEVALADRQVAPWVAHTHFAWNICEGPLREKAQNLWDVGYTGYYSVEHHSGRDEYPEVGIQIAKMRSVLDLLRRD